MWIPWEQMYVSKINAIQGGEVPDMSFMGVEQQVEFAEMDAVIAVDDLVEELGGPEAFSGDGSITGTSRHGRTRATIGVSPCPPQLYSTSAPPSPAHPPPACGAPALPA